MNPTFYIVQAIFLAVIAVILSHAPVSAEEASQAVTGPSPLGELFAHHEPPKVVPRLLDGADPSLTSIHVSLGRQRAYLSVGNEVAIDTPVSTGKPRAMTPKGQFFVLEKKSASSSPLFGEYVDSDGRVVRSSVSARTDVAPAGTTFRAVPAQYQIRLDDHGLAFHAGPLPGYPSSDVCIRLPSDIAPLFFQRVKVGTPVKIGD